MPQRFDVAVVGSGPAGASCALRLARSGYNVALIDSQGFPRPKLCGEYLSPGATSELDELGLKEALQPLCAGVETIRFSSHGRTAEIPLPRKAHSIPRILLDDAIRSEAIRAGAIPVRGRVTSISSSNADVNIDTLDEGETTTIAARYAVGADGMHSTVARALGLSIAVCASTFALGAHYSLAPLGATLELYVGDEGYLALNPGLSRSANVMFVFGERHLRQHARQLEQELARFSDAVSNGQRALSGMVTDERRRAIGPLAHGTRAITHGNVILVGDAAAFVDPFTGQGIFLALAGARLAASALFSVLTGRSKRDDAWRSYARELGGLIARRRRLSWVVHSLVARRALALSANALLRSAPVLFKPLIEAVSGGSSRR